MHCNNVPHRYYETNHDTKRIVELPQNRGRSIYVFFICQFLLLRFFSLKGKLKYLIIHFPYKLSNAILLSIQLSKTVPVVPDNE